MIIQLPFDGFIRENKEEKEGGKGKKQNYQNCKVTK
jgi:hypothetical protein